MKKIFINAISAKVGGGKSILVNFLTLLKLKKYDQIQFYILTPDDKVYGEYSTESIYIIDITSIFKNPLLFPLTFDIVLPRLCDKYNIDLIFNLADIPIKTTTEQLFVFDWAYAVYPNSIVWKRMNFKEYVIKKFKLFYFKKNIRYISLLLAQTETIKNHLEKLYGLNNVQVVPNAVSLDNLKNDVNFNFNLPEGIKLLYLTHYYTHKNLEIFLPLAKLIKAKKSKYRIIITLDKDQHKNANALLEQIRINKLEDIIINVGSVAMDKVPSLYQQTDALIMPTLLESFSGTYVEAIFHNKPIFTSDFDFAKDVCKDYAVYFDPLSHDDIYTKIENYYSQGISIQKTASNNFGRNFHLPKWEDVIEQYLNHIFKKVSYNE